MKVVRRSVLVGLLGAGLGCARSDWVGSTLVTVDVTGEWRGTFVRGLFGGARSEVT
jgi:hypothetical protein